MRGGNVTESPFPDESGESEQESGSSPPSSLEELFEEHLPFYLSIGMTPEQYYSGDPMLAKAYRKAQRLRERRENERQWRMGAYVYNAVLAASPVFHPFAKEGTKAHPYLSDPFPMTKEDLKQIELRRIKEAAEQFAHYAEMKNAERRKNDVHDD